MIQRRHFIAGGAALAAQPAAFAQGADFPAKPVTWVVPYPTGGFGDSLSRLLTQKMAESLKVPVIVENKPGAGGGIGVAWAKQQPADGYTVLYGDIGPFALNPSLYKRLPYDTLADFQPLTRLLSTPSVIVVGPQSPLNSFADLLKAAQSPRGLSYGSYGVGSAPHLWGEMLQRHVGSPLQHTPYKGAAPALQDLIGGHLDLLCDVVASSIPLVREGKVKALAVVGPDRRLAQLPDVPTLSELGLSQLNLSGWNGVMVRTGTPAPIAQRLHAEVVKALQSPEVVKRYTELGLGIAPQSPQEFGQFIAAETTRWGALIRQAGISVE